MGLKAFIWTWVVADSTFFAKDLVHGQGLQHPELLYADAISGLPLAIIVGLVAWGISAVRRHGRVVERRFLER